MKDNVEEQLHTMSQMQSHSMAAVTRELKASQDEQNLLRNRIRELESELNRVKLGKLQSIRRTPT